MTDEQAGLGDAGYWSHYLRRLETPKLLFGYGLPFTEQCVPYGTVMP